MQNYPDIYCFSLKQHAKFFTNSRMHPPPTQLHQLTPHFGDRPKDDLLPMQFFYRHREGGRGHLHSSKDQSRTFSRKTSQLLLPRGEGGTLESKKNFAANLNKRPKKFPRLWRQVTLMDFCRPPPHPRQGVRAKKTVSRSEKPVTPLGSRPVTE